MESFIGNIYRFIRSLFYNIRQAIFNGSNNSESLAIGYTYQDYDLFMNKQIFNGELISISLTWKELFLYLLLIGIVIFFIVFFVKLVFKVIGLICLR